VSYLKTGLKQMISEYSRPTPESLLAKLKETERAKLRVYIGAAAGVGKTYQMLEDVHHAGLYERLAAIAQSAAIVHK
jgi:hypothetical protein